MVAVCPLTSQNFDFKKIDKWYVEAILPNPALSHLEIKPSLPNAPIKACHVFVAWEVSEGAEIPMPVVVCRTLTALSLSPPHHTPTNPHICLIVSVPNDQVAISFPKVPATCRVIHSNMPS